MKLNYKLYLIGLISSLSVLAIYIYIVRVFSQVGTALFMFSISLIPIMFTLIFLKKQIFISWKKFAIPFIIFSASWITIAPEHCGGGWAGFGGCAFDKESTSMFTAGLLFIISVLIILIKTWQPDKPIKIKITMYLFVIFLIFGIFYYISPILSYFRNLL